jgi:hypothetical protein
MSSATIATLVKMVEGLPEEAQNQVVAHLRDYLIELQDEMEWDRLFANTQARLAEAARRARKEIAGGLARPMDHEHL